MLRQLRKLQPQTKNKSLTAAAHWAAAFYYLPDIINAGKRQVRVLL
jgi:hypothetical protein